MKQYEGKRTEVLLWKGSGSLNLYEYGISMNVSPSGETRVLRKAVVM